MRLATVISRCRQHKCDVKLCERVQLMYTQLVYKFGKAYRHQNFFGAARQVRAALKRLDDFAFLRQAEALLKVSNNKKAVDHH